MSTIALIGMTKIRYMPYMQMYLTQIDVNKHDVHLIYWDRDTSEDREISSTMQKHAFRLDMEDSIPLKRKLPLLLKYRTYIKKQLKQIQPDKLIVMHSTPAVLIYDLLKGKYSKKYILDYRDVTYERNVIYGKMVRSIISHAACTFTSSDGFRIFFPDDADVYTSHNITMDATLDRQPYCERLHKVSKPIVISFWGLLRHAPLNREMIQKLGGDPRFELHYYGRAQGAMLDLMEEATKKYNNVFFHGTYNINERNDFAMQTDLLHNIYDNSDKTTPLAMGNKYYDGPIYYIPQLVMKDSFMAKAVKRAGGIGLCCDPYSESFADDVYRYYTSLNKDSFAEKCDRELERILNEVEQDGIKIREVLENA